MAKSRHRKPENLRRYFKPSPQASRHDADLLLRTLLRHPRIVCATCGADDEALWGVRECARCALPRRVNALLDDGTGTAPTFLKPLVDTLCSAKNPASAEQ
jgi:hypothetical protein